MADHDNRCYPCSKDNHEHCLVEVIDANATDNHVIPCACPCGKEDEECESCGFETALPACEHDRKLCPGCKNECRPCEDAAAQDEAIDRRISELRGN